MNPLKTQVKTQVGNWSLNWKTIPRGREGVAQVEVNPGVTIEVRWRKDEDGIWLVFPQGVYGFDLQGQVDDSGGIVYEVTQRGSHLEWSGVLPQTGELSQVASKKGAGTKATRVRAQMPGKILGIMVKPEQIVQKGQPLLLMEAMKMENEICAPQAGKVGHIKVEEGQAVETGADLLLIEPFQTE